MLYELEPSVRDIFVEGPSDRAFVTGVMQRLTFSDMKVKEVDLIDVTDGHLASLGLESGSRQRVIALALTLEQTSDVDLRAQVICIADADDEAGTRPAFAGDLLIYTDVTSLPVYAFGAEYIQWYLDVGVLGFPLSGEDVVESLLPILRDAACARRAFKKLNVQCSLVDLTKDCTFDDKKLNFDNVRFVERLINKAAIHSRRDELNAELVRQRAALECESRHQLWAHSEDVNSLLHWLIVRLRGSSNTVASHLLCRTLLLGVPLEHVLVWPLFQEIRSRFNLAP
jgi:hypothetical protein